MLDPLRLQSLVDGECSLPERREILVHCESNPTHWRSVALAFIEEQQFAKHLSDPEVLRVPAPVANANVGTAVRAGTDSDALGDSVPQRRKNNWAPVLAASLIAAAAFATGQLTQTFFLRSDSGNTTHEIAENTPPPASRSNATAPNQQTQSPALASLNTSKQKSGLPETDLRVRLGNNDIPIYSPHDLAPELAMAKQAYDIQQANAQLRKQGFELNVRPKYMTNDLQDGRQLIIPVHDVGIVPYGQ